MLPTPGNETLNEITRGIDGARVSLALDPVLAELDKGFSRALNTLLDRVDRGELLPERAFEALLVLAITRRLRRNLEKAALAALSPAEIPLRGLRPIQEPEK